MKTLKQRAGTLMRVPADKLRPAVVNAVVDAGLRLMQPGRGTSVE
ncbi:hypothetical protein Q2E61_06030 [Microbulbifer thermotolerans]|nr:hypothetical protein [Microbulbifer thermotolerans]WKT61749.1 hypothetical protein Q2E61_06030 [Microbulbifer thermotolerans]